MQNNILTINLIFVIIFLLIGTGFATNLEIDLSIENEIEIKQILSGNKPIEQWNNEYGGVIITDIYPNEEDTNYNPRLSMNIYDYQNDSLTVIFKSNATGSWQTLGTYYGGNGIYNQDTSNMNIKGKLYFWSVCVFDGSIWANETYSFTAQPFVLKWTYSTGAGTSIGPLAVDVDDDGIYEVFATGEDKISCLNGSTGELIWDYIHSGISSHSPYEIHDLNNDGIPEVVISSGGRTIALHTNDGSVYWNVVAESAEKHLVIGDIEGDGYPYVYISSTDVYSIPPESGTGRLRKLRGTDGTILAEVFAWRPCWGGLSFADIDKDGDFELFMNDRSVNYHPPSLGKGIQCYDPEDLKLLWYDDGITCSSHCSALIDVNDDDILDAVSFQQDNSGIWCLDGKTGAKIPGKWANSLGLTGHSQFSIYDIDNDGNLEMITCTGAPAKVWDIGSWSLDATLDSFGEPPKMADVIGDSDLEIIGAGGNVKIYNNSYDLIETISTSAIASTLVQDIDNDSQNELILISSGGILKVYDTSAYAPTPRVRTNSLYYSERNMGAGVYVPLPGAPQPILKDEYPTNASENVGLNPTLSIHVIDFHYDLMNITISTNASGVWENVVTFTDVGNDFYEYMPTDIDETSTIYYWRVAAVDLYADNLTTSETFSFTTFTPPPFKPGWGGRKKIVIDHTKISENLTDFPVLINITDPDIATQAQTNGDDILFTSIDGATQLDHEIEYYDNINGDFVAWVKTNLSSTKDTILYMYYGNILATNQENVAGVWDENFIMVQHLEETSGNHYDSTSYDNDGTMIVVESQGTADGMIDGADYFDGNEDYIVVPDSDSLDINESLTISAWINPKSWGSNNMGRIIDKTLYTSYGLFLRDTGLERLSFYWYNGTTTDQVDSTTGSISLNKWQHIVVTFDQGIIIFYVDGIQNGIYSGRVNSIAANNEPLYIGNRESDLERDYDGVIDEIRISNVIRAESWVQTEYNNQHNPDDFYNVGAEEIAPNINSPVFSNEIPSDGTLDININQNSVNLTIKDPQGDPIDWTIEGLYVNDAAGTDEVNGSKSASLITPLPYVTNIVWFVNASDGINSTNAEYDFTTRSQYIPDLPDGFTATAVSESEIDLSWLKGDKTDNTYIEQNTVEYWSFGDGVMIYNDTDSSYSDTGLIDDSIYYYKVWSWNNTDKVFSTSYAEDNATTLNSIFSWEVCLNLTETQGAIDNMYIGEKTDASDGQDIYDVPKVGSPPPAPYIYLYSDTNLTTPYQRLWKDYRQYPDIYKEWNINVEWKPDGPDTGTNMTITWDNNILTSTEYDNIKLQRKGQLNSTWYNVADMKTVHNYTWFHENITATIWILTDEFKIICSMQPTEYLYQIPLKSEWNLISLPLNETINKDNITVNYLGVNYTWQQAVDNSTILGFTYGWNPTNQNYITTDNIEPGQSYWAYAYNNCTLWITTGIENTDDYITVLSSEWNLIGLPFNTEVEKTNLTIHYSGTDYTWQQAVDSNIVLSFIYGWNIVTQGYQTNNILYPGDGYWMYAYYDCVLKNI